VVTILYHLRMENRLFHPQARLDRAGISVSLGLVWIRFE